MRWLVDGTVVATGATPTIDFGSAAPRNVMLHVIEAAATDFSDVLTLNFGFNHTNDAGRYNIGGSYDHPAQPVTGITGLTYLTNLRRFCAANGPLTGHLDFTGLASLEFVECFLADVTSVDFTGCASLTRICFESNALSALDLNPVADTLRDVRAADQSSGVMYFTPLTSDLSVMYHFCVRQQILTNAPLDRLPVVEEL